MKKMEQIARFFVLVPALCLVLSIGYASASDEPAAEGHAVAVAQGAAADSHGTPSNSDAAQAEAGHGEDAGGHAVKNSLSAEKLKDLFWRVVNFIALMIILVKFGAKPIASGLAGRQKKIKEEIEDLETRKADAERSYREFEAKLATVEKDIDTIVEKAVAQAEIEKAKIIERAEQTAGDIKRQAELAIQNEIMDARRTLKNEVADQAAKLAEELIVKNLNQQDQVKIIEDYLDKVGAVQ